MVGSLITVPSAFFAIGCENECLWHWPHSVTSSLTNRFS